MSSLSQQKIIIFAGGTTPAQAIDACSVVKRHAPDASLCASPKDRLHYGQKYGFEYSELSPDDPLEGLLLNVFDSRRERIAASARSSPAVHFIEPLPILLFILGAIGSGFFNEIGTTLWGTLKSRLGRARDDTATEELSLLLLELSSLHDPKTSWNPVVFFYAPSAGITFVIEPGLSIAAARDAARLLLRRHRRGTATPLRWDYESNKWIRLAQPIQDESSFRNLQRDIHRLDRVRRNEA